MPLVLCNCTDWADISNEPCVQLDKYEQAKTKVCSGPDDLICLILIFSLTSQLAAAAPEDAESVVQDNCKLMLRVYNFSCPQSGHGSMAKYSDTKRYATMNDRKDS